MNNEPATLMDTFTARHFAAWTETHLHDDERDEVTACMLVAFADDPEYWSNRSWSDLREAVRS